MYTFNISNWCLEPQRTLSNSQNRRVDKKPLETPEKTSYRARWTCWHASQQDEETCSSAILLLSLFLSSLSSLFSWLFVMVVFRISSSSFVVVARRGCACVYHHAGVHKGLIIYLSFFYFISVCGVVSLTPCTLCTNCTSLTFLEWHPVR